MFVRGSSRKEVIQLNKKLFIFLQHEKSLYVWNEGIQATLSSKKILNKLSKKGMNLVSSDILIQDDSTIYYF